MLTTLEDLVIYICDPINGFDKNSLSARDRSILYSMASQLKKPLAFTEKQSDLAIKIIRDNLNIYESIEGLGEFLNSPKFSHPFRKVNLERRVFLNSENKIAIQYPFNVIFNKLLDKIPSKKIFDTKNKTNNFNLNEENIYKIVELFSNQNFDIDPILYGWYKEIIDIKTTPEHYVPSVDFVDDKLTLINCNQSVVNYLNEHKTDFLVSDAVTCKKLGLYFTKNLREAIANSDANNITKTILFSEKNHFYLQKKIEGSNEDIISFIKDAKTYPIMMFLDEHKSLKDDIEKWVTLFNGIGVSNKDISVLFRSDVNTDFNTYVKESELNNHVGNETKLVFVKNKIPKILYKLEFIPSLIISTSVFFVHYSAQRMIDSNPLVLYYTEQSDRSLGKKVAKL